MKLVLDAEAVSALLDAHHPQERRVRALMQAAQRTGREVTIATVTLAELYRGARRSQALDALLSGHRGSIMLRDTDRRLARLVGAILTEAEASSAQLADAHSVAAAVEAGGGVVLTSDPRDLDRLAAPYPTVIIEPLR